MSAQTRIDKAGLFESITRLLRGESVETLYKVSWVLDMRRRGLLSVQHTAWNREPEVFNLLKDMAQITPDRLLPKGLTGYYSVAPKATIAIHELVDLVRDLCVTHGLCSCDTLDSVEDTVSSPKE